MSKKIRSERSGGQTKTKTYTNGRCTSIQHTDNRTGKNHHHEVKHGICGSSAGKRKK